MVNTQHRLLSQSATRNALKAGTQFRVGERAVFVVIDEMECLFLDLANVAERNLMRENEMLEKEGLPPRKTLQGCDIKAAMNEIRRER